MIILNITRWPAILVFLLAGCAAVLFAFATVNLFSEAMASVDFLAEFGWQAIRVGALWQVAELTWFGAIALACWILFKICEHELVERYAHWTKGLDSRARTEKRASKA